MCVCAVPHRVVPLRLRGPNRSPEGEVVLPPVYCRHEEERQQAQIDTPPLLPHSSSRTTPHPTPLPRQTNCQCYINCSSSQTSVCTCCGHTHSILIHLSVCVTSQGSKQWGQRLLLQGQSCVNIWMRHLTGKSNKEPRLPETAPPGWVSIVPLLNVEPRRTPSLPH